MWETIKSFLGPAFSLIMSLVGGGPWGLIAFGVGAVALLVGGIFLYNKYKQIIFDNAQKKQNQDAVIDHENVVDKNIEHGKDDAISFEKSKTDKENAFKEDPPK